MPRKELVGIWQPCSSPRPVRGLSHCTLTGQIHSLRSLTDSPELKQEHLKLYIKCQECQSSGTKSIFDNIWLAGRHWKCWPWQRWHSAAPHHPAMVCAQMCGKGKENSAHGVGCAYGSKRIHAAEQGRFPATAKLMLFAHVHPSACAIGMSILGLWESWFTLELVQQPLLLLN